MDYTPTQHYSFIAAEMSGAPSVEKVKKLECALLREPQVPLDTSTVVHGRMASRTIFVPAGTVLTGALTNIDNICIVCGDITVTTDAGPKRLTGYHVIPASAGFKRAGIAHEDTYWTTVWHTDLTDSAEIENEMTSESASLQTRKFLTQEVNPWLSLSQQ